MTMFTTVHIPAARHTAMTVEPELPWHVFTAAMRRWLRPRKAA